MEDANVQFDVFCQEITKDENMLLQFDTNVAMAKLQQLAHKKILVLEEKTKEIVEGAKNALVSIGVELFDCPICWESDISENRKELPCGHHLCYPCLEQIQDVGNGFIVVTCPMCRSRKRIFNKRKRDSTQELSHTLLYSDSE